MQRLHWRPFSRCRPSLIARRSFCSASAHAQHDSNSASSGPAAPMVILNSLQRQILQRLRDKSDKAYVKRFMMSRFLFTQPALQGHVYCGTRRADRRQALLLDAAKVQLLRQLLLQGEQSPPASLVPPPEQQPGWRGLLEEVQQYMQLQALDMSEPSKVDAAFDAVRNHNRLVKEEEDRQQLQLAREMVHGGAPSLLVCVDLEWWERDPSRVLEIGWSCWDTKSRVICSRHWIVSENLRYANGRHVPDHRRAFGADFGSSSTGSQSKGVAALRQELEPGTWGLPGPGCRVALVGHGLSQDLVALEKIGLVLPPGTATLDTTSLASALSPGQGGQTPSLKCVLQWLKVPEVEKLHNAGNDARYTLEAFLRLCEPGQQPMPADLQGGSGQSAA